MGINNAESIVFCFVGLASGCLSSEFDKRKRIRKSADLYIMPGSHLLGLEKRLSPKRASSWLLEFPCERITPLGFWLV
jgi:hypothetical protein